MRRELSNLLVEEDEHRDAIYLMKDIVYEDEEYSEERLKDELFLAELYDYDNNPAKSEQYVYKAARWINETTNEELKKSFLVNKGRVQDQKGDFLNAAQTYYKAA